MTNQLKNITDLLNELTPLAKEMEKRRYESSDLGFNVFQLTSDTYYRENYHSYILYNLINPEYHEEGVLFLNLFIDCLNECGTVEIDKKDFQKPVVDRESNRIDVSIRDKVSGKSIIIENKINDAFDQPRQIPRYYEVETNAGFEVVGVVYLTLLEGKLVSTAAWKKVEIKEISEKLIYLPAVSQEKSNLVNNWLTKCISVSTHEDIPASLRQYQNLITYLSKHSMQTDLIEQFYQLSLKQEKFETIQQARDLLTSLCQHRAEKLIAHFQDKTTAFDTLRAFPFNKVFRAKFWDCSIPDLKWIDIECFENTTEIIFAAEDDCSEKDFQDFLTAHTEGSDLREKNALSATLVFDYPSQEEELYSYLTGLFSNLEILSKPETLS